ncbi:hypothetical protein IB223_06440 [Pseudoxanthomonas sp. PXM03]|uniref:hypothetical protein n=1 Tax=Pseudoxanthomonas sp. PXM03 TaxID=2769284 RepID=UPI00177BA039|nr:hypothetical protein [Pseudoxanthomonas sp. PXM03]MBD9435722.1 hypothetical protein [Pseudoxanthomonas sp. PXM03]
MRVALERRALDIINSSVGVGRPIPGFSYVAIDSWIDSIASQFGDDFISILRDVLYEVAEASRSEADISDEVFVDIDQEAAESTFQLLTSVLEKAERL